MEEIFEAFKTVVQDWEQDPLKRAKITMLKAILSSDEVIVIHKKDEVLKYVHTDLENIGESINHLTLVSNHLEDQYQNMKIKNLLNGIL